MLSIVGGRTQVIWVHDDFGSAYGGTKNETTGLFEGGHGMRGTYTFELDVEDGWDEGYCAVNCKHSQAWDQNCKCRLA